MSPHYISVSCGYVGTNKGPIKFSWRWFVCHQFLQKRTNSRYLRAVTAGKKELADVSLFHNGVLKKILLDAYVCLQRIPAGTAL